MELTDKVAVVTGSGQGLGPAYASGVGKRLESYGIPMPALPATSQGAAG